MQADLYSMCTYVLMEVESSISTIYDAIYDTLLIEMEKEMFYFICYQNMSD